MISLLKEHYFSVLIFIIIILKHYYLLEHYENPELIRARIADLILIILNYSQIRLPLQGMC